MSDSEIDPKLRELVGEIGSDPEALAQRYAYERDIRLRPDANRQYLETTAEFSHYVDDPYVEPLVRDPLNDHVEVVIIGGGFGGLLAASKLRQAGFEQIRIIEKGGDFGGAWYWNRYPGIRCDTESYVYVPLIEETGKFPREKYSRGSEIFSQARQIAEQYDLYRGACLQTAVTGLQWNEDWSVWQISTDRSDAMTADFVVMANGLLAKPKLPGIPGIETFQGHTFHTSRWDFSYTGGDETGGLTGLADKRVGVAGTGATAVQVIPQVGAWAKQLYVFQRTPAAVDIRANRPTDELWKNSLRPGWQKHRIQNFNYAVAGKPQATDLVCDGFTEVGRLLDSAAGWAEPAVGRPLTEIEADFVTGSIDDQKMDAIRARIDAEVHDSGLAEALKPWHRRWCKRPLFSDDYLPTFNRPNVTLVDTAGRGIERITETGAIVGDKEYPLDCLIFATGFETGTEYTHRAGYDVVGRNGTELSQYWRKGVKTLHGMFVRGFPNLMIVGSVQGANAVSYTFALGEMATHAAYVLSEVRRNGAKRFEPSAAAVEGYVAEVKPLSVSQRKFWLDCTPSYMNSEGDSGNPHGFFANTHPAGTVGFYDMLANWRAVGGVEGLEMTS